MAKPKTQHWIYFHDRYGDQIQRTKTHNWMETDEMIVHARAIAPRFAESFTIYKEVRGAEPERIAGALPCR